MPDSVSHAQDDLVRQVVARLEGEYRGRHRFSNGEKWIDSFCPFHDDGQRRGFSFQVDTLACVCRHGDEITFDDLCRKFGLVHAVSQGPNAPSPAAQRAAGARKASQLLARPTPAHQATSPTLPGPTPQNGSSAKPKVLKKTPFTYFAPDSGEPSLIVTRIDYEDGSKEFFPSHPDGTPGDPPGLHPVYGDRQLPKGCILVIVEGEGCVDAVNAIDLTLDAPIRALTWPHGSGSAKKFAYEFAARVAELDPHYVVLWPDNDVPGQKAMSSIAEALREIGIRPVRVRPKEHGWPPKYDVADYLKAGHSLGEIIQKTATELPSAGIDDFCRQVIVTDGFRMVFPGTRHLAPITEKEIAAAWFKIKGSMPRPSQTQQALAMLTRRAREAPFPVPYRTYADSDCFYWRPTAHGRCLRIDKDGISDCDDPPGLMLAIHRTEPLYSPEVDRDGVYADYLQLCAMFRLSELDTQWVFAWLISAACGLQTPILMLRGEAGTAKTTFARALASILEPIVVEVDTTGKDRGEERQFMQLLQLSSVILLDNVSSLARGMEDTLSKLVTGFTVGIRPLWTDETNLHRLQKAIILTTVTYDVQKSDLASRMIIASPSIDPAAGYLPDRTIKERLNQIIPKVRGAIFNEAAAFYCAREPYRDEGTALRGDAGWVLRTLGKNVDDLVRQEIALKAEIINQNDLLLDAIVQYWDQSCHRMATKVGAAELIGEISDIMRDVGVDPADLPRASSRFKRYMEDKQQIFKDHGFTIRAFRQAKKRGYEFEPVK